MTISKKILYLVETAFFIFTLLTIGVIQGGLKTFDLNATNTIQGLIPKSLDTFLSIFSVLGTFEVMTLLLLVTLFFYRKIDKIKIICFYVIGLIMEVIGKKFVHHISPPTNFFRYNLNFIFPSSYVRTGFSYPSGHAARTTFLVFMIGTMVYNSRRMNIKTKVALLVILSMLLFIMLISRISLGEHWTSDVIAGLLLGICTSFFALFRFGKLFSGRVGIN